MSNDRKEFLFGPFLLHETKFKAEYILYDDNTNNNRHDINLYDNDLYDNLVDIKSLNSINSNEEFNTLNDIDDELLTIN